MSSISKDLRILCLKSVLNPDLEYFYRHVFRWYSKEFHTALHLVPDLPLVDVLQAYYETRYEDIVRDEDGTKLTEELRELTETEIEKLLREMKESDAAKEEEDNDFIKQIIEEEKRKKPKDQAKPVTQPPLDLNRPEPGGPRKLEPFPENENINMDFSKISSGELEDWDLFGPVKKK